MSGQTRDWGTFREGIASQLLKQTGQDVAAWNARVLEQDLPDENALRAWLGTQGVTGYPQMLLVMERFGYPDFFLASSDELIDAQYRDRPGLRPILDAVLALAGTFGEVTIQTRKTYVALVTPRRTFAAVQPTTKSRVDLGLRLDGQSAEGRLQRARSMGSGSVNVRMALTSLEEVDDEVASWLRRAYQQNL